MTAEATAADSNTTPKGSASPAPETSNGAHLAYEGVHFGDVMAAFGNGVQLDIRAKLAVDFLKSGMLARPAELMALARALLPPGAEPKPAFIARLLAEFATDLATELLNVAFERDLVKQLPDTDELTAATRLHIRRSLRMQIFQQMAGQEIAREEGMSDPRLALAAGMPR